MDKEILDWLNKQPIGCLAVSIDGAPHTAALHFSVVAEPFKLFFQTAKDSKKCAALKNSDRASASFTTGFSEQEWKTIQMDGSIRFARTSEMDEFQTVHYGKNPEAKKHAGEGSAYLVFEPTWWRFSDFNVKPVKIIEKN